MAEKTRAELQEELEQAQAEAKRLQGQLSDERKAAAELQQQNAELEEELTKLEEQLEQFATEKKVGRPVLMLEGKRYQLNSSRFQFQGEVHTPETLKERPEVVAELLKIGSGAVTEIAEG